jgi:TerC family integral membrane protein
MVIIFWCVASSTAGTRLVGDPLLLTLLLVESADLVFAVDSIPAIFAITQDPFLVYTSNIFAILGLRALYFALSAMVHRFEYLKYSLAIVLVFIGVKVGLVYLNDIQLVQFHIPTGVSLVVTLGLLAGGVLYSCTRRAMRRATACHEAVLTASTRLRCSGRAALQQPGFLLVASRLCR